MKLSKTEEKYNFAKEILKKFKISSVCKNCTKNIINKEELNSAYNYAENLIKTNDKKAIELFIDGKTIYFALVSQVAEMQKCKCK